MTTAHIKRVIRIGGSLAIILPSDWTKGNVKAGEEVVVVADGELRIFPVHESGGRVDHARGSVSNQYGKTTEPKYA